MATTKTNPTKALAADPDQAVVLLTKMSDLLKQHRRHFDDAVVAHCIRLIGEYVEELPPEAKATGRPHAAESGRNS